MTTGATHPATEGRADGTLRRLLVAAAVGAALSLFDNALLVWGDLFDEVPVGPRYWSMLAFNFLLIAFLFGSAVFVVTTVAHLVKARRHRAS